ncbi:snRNA-activating protein complex subunit 5 isoform X2 [Hyperolius riggenbachi]|uniref:snRNA-activating protein complex subunit 5 isoform X2 n=1 Tax=Hyperolius riggenbachi TaxID=752182 RepID=UPI0035A2804D
MGCVRHSTAPCYQVEELALQSMISSGESQDVQSPAEEPEEDSQNVDDETVINRTELQLDKPDYNDEEMEEEDSDT